MQNQNQNQPQNQNQAEISLEALQSFLESNKDKEEVKNVLSQYAPKQELNLETIKRYLNENPEAQSFFDTEKNRHLETWKKNNLEKIIEEELKKRGIVEDETTKKIRELEERFLEAERKAKMAELKVLAKDYAKEKQLPFEMVDYLIAEDEEQTMKNLQEFEKVWVNALQKAVEEKIGSSSRTPVKPSKDDVLPMTKEEFRKLSYLERVKLKNSNPELYEKLAKS